MNKVLIAIIFGIVLIGFASAETIYSGSTVYYDFTDEVDVIQEITWEVVNNTYNLEGLNITTNLTGATVSLDPLFKPDNFTIIFTIIGKNEKVEVPASSSGRRTKSKTKYIDRYITEYKDKIVYDDIEIIELSDKIDSLRDKLNIKNAQILVIILVFLTVDIIVFVYLIDYIHKIKKRIKNGKTKHIK